MSCVSTSGNVRGRCPGECCRASSHLGRGLLRLWVALMMVASLVSVDTVSAQFGGNQVYNVHVLDGPSFARVTIETSPKKPLARAKTFDVVVERDVHIYRSYDEESKTMTVQSLTIPAGAASATIEIPYTPKSPNGTRQHIFLFIDDDGSHQFDSKRDMFVASLPMASRGQHFGMTLLASSKFTSSHEVHWRVARNQWRQTAELWPNSAEALPTLQYLYVVFSLHGISGMSSAFAQENAETIAANETPVSICQTSDMIGGCPLSDLPETWLGLGNVRDLLISHDDLGTLRKSRPGAFRALLEWTAMGGHLFIYGCGEVTGDERAMAALLRSPDVEGETARSKSLGPWLAPSEFLKKQRVDLSSAYSSQLDEDSGDDEMGSWKQNEESPYRLVRPQSKDQDELLVTDFNRGYVVCVRSDMTNWKMPEWRLLWNVQLCLERSIPTETGSAVMKQCLDPKFPIPTLVETPPVLFQILISGFVLLVGPVFFLVFRFTRRLYLWLFLTPLVSIIACAGMVVFAYWYEGFDTRGRIESVSFLDHRVGFGSQHIRYGYYAPVQPLGYTFAPEFRIYDSRQRGAADTVITRQEDAVLIQGGDIRSRIEHQLTAIRPVRAVQLVTMFRDQDGQRVIRNLTQVPIAFVTFFEAGQFYTAEHLAANATAPAKELAWRNVVTRLTDLVDRHAPRNTDDMKTSRVYSVYGLTGDGGAIGFVHAELDSVREELGYSGKLPCGELDRDEIHGIMPLRNGQYLVVFLEDVLTPDPVPDAIYDKYKFHVVIGQH